MGDHNGHQNRQQQGREGVDGVGDHHEYAVDPAAEIAGDQSQQHTREDGQQHGDDDGDDRSAGTPHHTAEHVIASGGRTPDMFG